MMAHHTRTGKDQGVTGGTSSCCIVGIIMYLAIKDFDFEKSFRSADLYIMCHGLGSAQIKATFRKDLWNISPWLGQGWTRPLVSVSQIDPALGPLAESNLGCNFLNRFLRVGYLDCLLHYPNVGAGSRTRGSWLLFAFESIMPWTLRLKNPSNMFGIGIWLLRSNHVSGHYGVIMTTCIWSLWSNHGNIFLFTGVKFWYLVAME